MSCFDEDASLVVSLEVVRAGRVERAARVSGVLYSIMMVFFKRTLSGSLELFRLLMRDEG